MVQQQSPPRDGGTAGDAGIAWTPTTQHLARTIARITHHVRCALSHRCGCVRNLSFGLVRSLARLGAPILHLFFGGVRKSARA